MRVVNSAKLRELQNKPENIRNICIVAHVDHGKTTLADSLIASNGIISTRLSGKLRYMDSRPDEQERGITMKCSSIALYHSSAPEGESAHREYLINLLDSPGHVDFSSEVSTAVRLCDGAVVVVDAVEGVCPQTRLALAQAWAERAAAVLVLNKVDRLALELRLAPLDAYHHLWRLLEQVNAIVGELFATQVSQDEETTIQKQETEKSGGEGTAGREGGEEGRSYDWTSALEAADDSHLYFSPEHGNVLFASAIDGWGFTTSTFSKLFSQKLGVKEESLHKVLWGDFYLDRKSKRFMRGAAAHAQTPLFAQLVLANVWALYEALPLRQERWRAGELAERLGVTLDARDLRHTDAREQLRAIMTRWLPLAPTLLDMVAARLPSPRTIHHEKVERLMCSPSRDFLSLHPDTRRLRDHFLACAADTERPLIVFVAKMFPVERASLPENRAKPLTPEEMARRRERARQSREERRAAEEEGRESEAKEAAAEEEPNVDNTEEKAFVAFARVFSGRVRRGSRVYVLGPKYDPMRALTDPNFSVDSDSTLKDLQSHQHVTCTEIKSLYLLMGRELEFIDEAIAGNIIGIGGLEAHVLKSATLSDSLACVAFSELQHAAPILRVAVGPECPSDLPQLVKGLRLLNQADSCVQVLVAENGEHVLATAGEVHLERCLQDLRNDYAKIPITVSEPIVPFKETIIEPPKIDMVNEEIDGQNIGKDKMENDKSIVVVTNNKQCTIRLRAIPLPPDVTALLENNSELLKLISQHIKTLQGMNRNREKLENLHIDDNNTNIVKSSQLSETVKKSIRNFKEELNRCFSKAGHEWEGAVEEIWSVGPRNCGTNVLLNRTGDYATHFLDVAQTETGVEVDARRQYESSFINGFQLATLAGPLCEEPMCGVAFVVEHWSITCATEPTLPGQIMSGVKEGCRRAFQAQPQRLVAAMYSCHVQCNQQVLGKPSIYV